MTEPRSIRPALRLARRSAARRAVRQERGAASIEYALVTTGVIAALFLVPIPPTNDSAVEIVLAALRGFQHHTTYLLSLP